jgi:hypothetical protein
MYNYGARRFGIGLRTAAPILEGAEAMEKAPSDQSSSQSC